VHNQVFQDREFLIEYLNQPPQILNREEKAEVADAMALLESKAISLLIFCSDAMLTAVVDGKRKGG